MADNKHHEDVANLIPTLMEIKDLHFNSSNPGESAIFPGPKKLSSYTPQFVEFALGLFAVIRGQATPDRSSYVTEHCGVRFRCQELATGSFGCRVMKDEPPRLDSLGFSKAHTNVLVSQQLRTAGGLVLVCGATGSGKTTTVSAVVKAYLEQFGGYAMTLEDPPEYKLAGWHGNNGYCDQILIKTGNYRTEMVNALRGFPSEDRSILLLGEIRESIAASELLRIGVDGHLVFATMHADGPISAITRLISIAKEEIGEIEARQLLASCIKLVVHLRRDNQVPQLTLLRFDRQQDNQGKVAISKTDGSLATLNSLLEQQVLDYEASE